MRYKGRIDAISGLLLGGVKTAESVWLDYEPHAIKWALQARDTNKGAGRDPGPAAVVQSDGTIYTVDETTLKEIDALRDAQTIPADGYADGGTPYTDDELNAKT